MVPRLAQRALDLAAEHGFSESSIEPVGALLRDLASDAMPGTILEIGTGFGHGLAWILDGRRPDHHVITVDNDAQRTQAVSEAFSEVKDLDIITGDWRDVLAKGPFSLVFADGGRSKETYPNLLLEALEIGGSIVMDDLRPQETWPDEWQGKIDHVRSFWLHHPDVVATETEVSVDHMVIVAVRVRDHRGRGGLPRSPD